MHIETEATQYLQHAAVSARTASHVLARMPDAARNAALRAMAASLRSQPSDIIAANAADLAACTGTAAFRDRLALNEARVHAMARGLEDIALLPDPLGRTLADWTRPNGLRIQRIATPIGVIGMIYESRPNVGADAAGICLKSGNAMILRGGSESVRSAAAINAALVAGLRAVGLPEACVQIAPNADRAYVGAMLAAAGLLDLIVPRGGSRWSSACSARRACRCSRTPKGFATPTCTPLRITRWRVASWPTRRCVAPASAAPPRLC